MDGPRLEHVSVVLVEPRYGGNLGSVARVMANFGLAELVLVRPAEGIFQDPRLEPMARGAVGLVRSARVHPDLASALSGVELAMGFTTRLGRRRAEALELRAALEQAAAHAPRARLAAVFGREDAGLTTAELDLCHWLVRIPSEPGFPSLNLAQAVGVFAYELRMVRSGGRAEGEPELRPAPVDELEALYAHFERVLWRIGFIEEDSPARMMNQVRRIFSRRLPESRDVRILRGILSKVELALERARKGLPVGREPPNP